MGPSDAEVLRVLLVARRLLLAGWIQGHAWVDDRGCDVPDQMGPRVAWSLIGALSHAAKGELVGEHAKKLLRRIAGDVNLVAWNDHPLRELGEVVHLVDRGIAMVGGRIPRRGGWRISSGPVASSGELRAPTLLAARKGGR